MQLGHCKCNAPADPVDIFSVGENMEGHSAAQSQTSAGLTGKAHNRKFRCYQIAVHLESSLHCWQRIARATAHVYRTVMVAAQARAWKMIASRCLVGLPAICCDGICTSQPMLSGSKLASAVRINLIEDTSSFKGLVLIEDISLSVVIFDLIVDSAPT